MRERTDSERREGVSKGRAAEGVERQRENGTSKVASASSSNRQRERWRRESAGCAALKSGAVAAPITSTLNCNCLQSSSLPLLRCMRIE